MQSTPDGAHSTRGSQKSPIPCNISTACVQCSEEHRWAARTRAVRSNAWAHRAKFRFAMADEERAPRVGDAVMVMTDAELIPPADTSSVTDLVVSSGIGWAFGNLLEVADDDFVVGTGQGHHEALSGR